MLRVTKLTDYATVVLTVLAARQGQVLSAAELAEHSGLEQPTVSKLLKPLAQARRDRDNIYAVIKGSAISHGGRNSGYAVPNSRAQSDVISAALKRANVDARSIGYIEAHGTGTELGDPIEIAGLNQTFERYNAPPHSCAIGLPPPDAPGAGGGPAWAWSRSV